VAIRTEAAKLFFQWKRCTDECTAHVRGLASILFRSGGNTHNRLDGMTRIFSLRRLGESAFRGVVRLAASIFFAAGLVLGIVALAPDTSPQRRKPNHTALPASPRHHVT